MTGIDRGHFVVIDYGYETTLHGVFNTFQDASNSVHDAWLRHPSNRANYRPDVQEWDGDGYVRHWQFDGEQLVEIDFR